MKKLVFGSTVFFFKKTQEEIMMSILLNQRFLRQNKIED